jgi:hypothetical protein
MKWVLLAVFGGLGLAALLGGLLWGWNRIPLFQSGARTTGVVVGQEETVSARAKVGRHLSGSQETIRYSPIVEFSDNNAETQRFVASTGGEGKPIIATGTEVEVIYDPADPSKAQIGSFEQFWLGPVVVAVCGLIFLLMGVGGFFLMGGSDRRLEEQAAMMRRERLIFASGAPVFEGSIVRTEERPPGSGRYVFVCKGARPGAVVAEEFVSDFLPFDPGQRYRGRKVTIHIDPTEPDLYFVDINTLLPEIMESRR